MDVPDKIILKLEIEDTDVIITLTQYICVCTKDKDGAARYGESRTRSSYRLRAVVLISWGSELAR